MKDILDILKNIETITETPNAFEVLKDLERVLDEISFEATDLPETKVSVDAKYVKKHIGNLADTSDLSKFIL